MLRQIRLLTAVQMRNLLGINEALHSHDPRKKGRLVGMAALFLLLGAIACAYVGLLSYGMIHIGMGQLIPALLALAISLVILCFTTLRAGTVVFDLASYERLIAMPIRPTAIVVSRFLTMYGVDAALAMLILLPATVVYGVMLHPEVGFYPRMLLGALVLPLLPMAIALLLGGLVYFISSRMRHRNLAVTVLSMLGLLALMAGSFLLSGSKSLDVTEMADFAAAASEALCAGFPPAAWFARGVVAGTSLEYAALILVSLGVFVPVALLLGVKFQKVCALLSARASRGGYAFSAQKSTSVRKALFRREWRRYFASPIYVLNTLSGCVMGILLCIGLMILGAKTMAAQMQIPVELLIHYAPLFLAFMLTLSPSTCCCISMEGKSFWIAGSLPVDAREIYRAKLQLCYSLEAPCWAVCEVLLMLTLKPEGWGCLWMLLCPLAYLVFGGVLGLWINICAPMLNWESERQPVKQSRSVSYTVLAGMAAILIPGVAIVILPEKWRLLLQAVVLCLLFAGAGLLWHRCKRVPLNTIH